MKLFNESVINKFKDFNLSKQIEFIQSAFSDFQRISDRFLIEISKTPNFNDVRLKTKVGDTIYAIRSQKNVFLSDLTELVKEYGKPASFEEIRHLIKEAYREIASKKTIYLSDFFESDHFFVFSLYYRSDFFEDTIKCINSPDLNSNFDFNLKELSIELIKAIYGNFSQSTLKNRFVQDNELIFLLNALENKNPSEAISTSLSDVSFREISLSTALDFLTKDQDIYIKTKNGDRKYRLVVEHIDIIVDILAHRETLTKQETELFQSFVNSTLFNDFYLPELVNSDWVKIDDLVVQMARLNFPPIFPLFESKKIYVDHLIKTSYLYAQYNNSYSAILEKLTSRLFNDSFIETIYAIKSDLNNLESTEFFKALNLSKLNPFFLKVVDNFKSNGFMPTTDLKSQEKQQNAFLKKFMKHFLKNGISTYFEKESNDEECKHIIRCLKLRMYPKYYATFEKEILLVANPKIENILPYGLQVTADKIKLKSEISPLEQDIVDYENYINNICIPNMANKVREIWIEELRKKRIEEKEIENQKETLFKSLTQAVKEFKHCLSEKLNG